MNKCIKCQCIFTKLHLSLNNNYAIPFAPVFDMNFMLLLKQNKNMIFLISRNKLTLKILLIDNKPETVSVTPDTFATIIRVD